MLNTFGQLREIDHIMSIPTHFTKLDSFSS